MVFNNHDNSNLGNIAIRAPAANSVTTLFCITKEEKEEKKRKQTSKEDENATQSIVLLLSGLQPAAAFAAGRTGGPGKSDVGQSL